MLHACAFIVWAAVWLCNVAVSSKLSAGLPVIQVLFPAIKSRLEPSSRRAKDGTFLHLVSMKTLYKVFERC